MANAKSLIPNLKNAKWGQYALIAGVGLAAYGVLYFLMLPDTKPSAIADNKEAKTTNMLSAGQQIDPKDRWVGAAGQKIAQQEDMIRALSGKATDQESKLTNLEKTITEKLSAFQSQQGQAYPPGTPGPGGPLTPALLPPAPPALPLGTAGTLTSPVGAPRLPSGAPPAIIEREVRPEPSIGRLSLRAAIAPGAAGTAGGSAYAAPVSQAALANGGAAPPKEKKSGQSYLPIGFVQARIIGGLDAPTNGQAQSEPLPLILEVVDHAILPNAWRANLKKCLLVGESWGDISSERAYGRIRTLSCIRNDGKVLEARARASVYGEDGKYGVRGRLVSKQGQILANALFAGVISGIGQGIQFRSTTTQVTSAGGVIQTPNNPNQGFEAGFGTGIGRALDRLSNYYIQLAEKTFPVIEIDAGRIVDVAFTSGIDLDVPLPDDDEQFDSRKPPGRQEFAYVD
jgi:conjugal transfer pilus assembly protein TraB